MEKIMLVMDSDLSFINKELREGWKVKLISATATSADNSYYSKVYAYVVLEKSV